MCALRFDRVDGIPELVAFRTAEDFLSLLRKRPLIAALLAYFGDFHLLLIIVLGLMHCFGTVNADFHALQDVNNFV